MTEIITSNLLSLIQPSDSSPDDKVDSRIKKAIRDYEKAQELKPYQIELIKLQKHLDRYQKKMIVLFDGRDASGKGGTIRRITWYMNAKRYRVVALGPPNHNQKTELYMKRYVEHFPHAGEMVFFDRSWYNRALVEPVLDFCTTKQYKSFMKHVNSYESSFLDDGKTVLLKLYISVSKKEQKRRFDARQSNPLKQWKLSEVDLQAQRLWDEFTEKKYKMLKKTNTDLAPWTIIRSNNKHLARLETIKVILNSIRYRSRNRDLDFSPNPKIVRTGTYELGIMKREKKEHGKPIT